MDKKGFTLIELIVTILLLGLVGVVVSVNMIKVINNEKEKKIEDFEILIEEAACTYAGLSTTDCTSGCTITGNTLINEGLMDEEVNGIKTIEYEVEVSYTDGKKNCEMK